LGILRERCSATAPHGSQDRFDPLQRHADVHLGTWKLRPQLRLGVGLATKIDHPHHGTQSRVPPSCPTSCRHTLAPSAQRPHVHCPTPAVLPHAHPTAIIAPMSTSDTPRSAQGAPAGAQVDEEIPIADDMIRLGQFLKLANLV